MVPSNQVHDAVATNETRRQLASLVGPSLGGTLFAWGRAWPFIVDMASYIISFITVLTVRTNLRPEVPREASDFRAELVDGLRWLWKQRFLRSITLWLSAAGVLFTSMGLVTLVLARDLGASSPEIGLMFTISGAGGFVGALAGPWLLRHLRPGVVVIGYAWIATAATYALLAAQSVGALGIIGAVAFFPVPTVNALVMARIAQKVPDAFHGRVFSATTQLTTLFDPVGPALAGITLQTQGSTTTVGIYASLFTVLAILATASPALRREGSQPQTG